MRLKSAVILMAGALLAACGPGDTGPADAGTTVSGSVTVAGAEDAAGVLVSLIGEQTRSKVTGADGKFSFEGVADGPWAVAVEAADTTEGRKLLSFKLTSGQGGDVGTLRLTASGAVEGTVTLTQGGSPAGFMVTVGGTDRSAVVGDDGRFVLFNVPAGERTLVAVRESHASASTTVVVPRGGRATAAIDLDIEREIEEVRTGVTGRVSYFSFEDASNVVVRAAGLPGVEATADASGRYTLPLPAGTWELTAVAPGYPRQRIANVNVTSGGFTELPGTYVLSSFYRFPNPDDSYVDDEPEVRLLADGRHAIISRYSNQHVLHAIHDLETGRESPFYVEWNWNDGHDFIVGRTGRAVALVGCWNYCGDDVQIFDTVTGRRVLLKAPDSSRGFQQEQAGFSSDEAYFFIWRSDALLRVEVATGDVVTLEGLGALRITADRYFVVTPVEDAAVVKVSLLTTAGVQVLTSEVDFGASTTAAPPRFTFMSDCATACRPQIIDAEAGTVYPVQGGPFPADVKWASTEHAFWARLESATFNAWVDLRNGNSTPWPAGFTSADADMTVIGPDGTRAALLRNGGTTVHVGPMPLTAIPDQAGTASTSRFWLWWLGPTQVVAVDSDSERVLAVRGQEVTDFDVTPGSIHSYATTVTWRDAADHAWKFLHEDHGVQVLAEDPKSELSIEGHDPTRDAAWTYWELVSPARHYMIKAVKSGTTTLRSYPDLRMEGEFPPSHSGVSVARGYGDRLDLVLDLETGGTRLLWERDLLDFDSFLEEGAARTSSATTRRDARSTCGAAIPAGSPRRASSSTRPWRAPAGPSGSPPSTGRSEGPRR